MTDRKKVYINIDPLLNDTDSLIKYCSSDRSDGKTTKIITLAYDTFKETGKIGVIARRWSTDITTMWVQTLFTNLKKMLKMRNAAEPVLKGTGSPKRDGVHLYADGAEFAVCVPLSRSGSVKSAFDVATHKNLYIDEYIPLNGRYFKNEVEAILEILRTIDRDTWTNYALIMSNHICGTCPLFSYFGVLPRDGISRWKNGRFCMLQVANKGNREQVKLSPLGELVEGTPYGDYAAGGFIIDHSARVMTTHTRVSLNYGITAAGKKYAFYQATGGAIVIDYIRDTPPPLMLNLEPNGGHAGGVYLKYMTDIVKYLKTIYYNSKLFCASEQIYYELTDLWKILH